MMEEDSSRIVKMADYQVTVSTSYLDDAGTCDHVFIKLVGKDGESERTRLMDSKEESSFIRGAVSTFTMSCPVSIGKLVRIELEKQPSQNPEKWFPTKVEVKSPEEGTFKFPIRSWITDSEVHRFREGIEPGKRPFEKLFSAIRPPEESTSNFPSDRRQTGTRELRFGGGTEPGKRPFKKLFSVICPPEGGTSNFPSDRQQTGTRELRFGGRTDRNQREKDYRWHEHAEGIPHCMKAEHLSDLPPEVQFSFTKEAEFKLTAAFGLAELYLNGLADSRENWLDIDAIKGVFWCKRTDILDYVQEHWKEDAFFAYQFLNGVNPMLIRRCSALPDNFPVTDDMVFPSGQFSLAKEMKKGNIFLCDYKRLEGVKANTIHGKQQYLMAPLVLLHKTPDYELMPVAIQLKQNPAEDNPIFLPTDSEYDWLTAKIFVRSADFNEHQINSHLLRTHLLAEVFAVSLLRNVARTHPLYKVLAAHTRYTLQINFLARDRLISETGVFTKFAASGGEGLVTLLQKSLSSVTYSSLCMPEDIAERGLEDVPNFYYRDDGLKLWDIIHRFVQAVLGFYYKNNDAVKEDDELQKWIGDIFEHGFLSQEGTGIPQSFTTVEELVKFVTMVIFTCSAQHSAVNTGQYDYGGWMPNTPISLQLPPPAKKGTTSEATMLQTLPDMGTTANGMAVMWLLSKSSYDFVALGKSLEDHHSEEIPSHYVKAFQGELQTLSAHINIRNMSLEVPYTYLDPAVIENSVAI
ncbi:polyunsaturated fatty acid lipoxygenase ALOX15B-like [Epinephelus fuscoguttatus]|uniref:polyunsaturated fatty acid lipoxygenase ALOX15B-like n=1 Tax=Epinephelus fuscoguttatus TaxID=293821 RepID=UPI0020D013AE|nr:polyunsaturated fatty acid lipoxygenase ALOX15B-like [Epinephelus fuscoguttatus]